MEVARLVAEELGALAGSSGIRMPSLAHFVPTTKPCLFSLEKPTAASAKHTRGQCQGPPGPAQVLTRKPPRAWQCNPPNWLSPVGVPVLGTGSLRSVDPEDLRVSSTLSGTRERTMKMNCTCAAEMLGTGSRDPLGLHHIPDSVPTVPVPLPGSDRAPA